MQPASSLERPPLSAGLVAIAATVWLARPTPPPPAAHHAMCPRLACSSELVGAGAFGRAAFLFTLQHRPDCARAARQLAIVYHVAMAPNTEPMEAFAAVQRAILIDHHSFGGTLAELYPRRHAVAAAAARAYDARGLTAWTRQANLFR
jgi:hypothetical protein